VSCSPLALPVCVRVVLGRCCSPCFIVVVFSLGLLLVAFVGQILCSLYLYLNSFFLLLLVLLVRLDA
jgi:hypothetical protein